MMQMRCFGDGRRRPLHHSGALACVVSVCLAVCLVTPNAAAAAPSSGASTGASTGASAGASTGPAQREVSGHRMAVSGTVFIIASALGYIAMAAGLGIGNRAEADVRTLGAADELDQRREVMERGQLGNRLALGAGISAAVLMGAGIGLTVAGRRRVAAARGLSLMPLRRGAGAQLSLRF